MSDPNAASHRRSARSGGRPVGTWATIAVLLGACIVVPLLVPLYDKETPALWGFPFYYWFQFMMIPVVSVLTYISFKLSLRAARQERRTVGLPPEPTDEPVEGER